MILIWVIETPSSSDELALAILGMILFMFNVMTVLIFLKMGINYLPLLHEKE
jgi:hypothetical protein